MTSYRIVPVEPTRAMRDVGNDYDWRDMLAAAPPYVVTDADVRKAILAAEAYSRAPKSMSITPGEMRAGLGAFVKGLEAK